MGVTLDLNPVISSARDGAGVAGSTRALLLERERELEQVDGVLASAARGTGAALIIEGAAGIGKTALLHAARERAVTRGLTVLHARGTELETDYPFGVVRQCLEPVVRGVDERERERLLAGAAGLAAPVVLDGSGEGASTSYGVLYGLYWLLFNRAERSPLLVAVDDVQWADEPSLRFLSFLVHRLESLPVAVVLAMRSGEGGDLAGLRADPLSEVLTPAPLDEAAISELLRASGAEVVDTAFAEAAHYATGGNPFLLVELVQSLREESIPFTADAAKRVSALAPREVTRSVRARLARLDPSARGLARALAVLGDDVPLELAAALAGLDLDGSSDAAHALVGVDLLDPGRLLRFRHPLLRAAATAALTPREREATHRLAADLLRARGAPPERVALHILASAPGRDPADVGTLRAAARRVCERGAPEAAMPLWARALEEPIDMNERVAVLFELGVTELTAGQHDAAEEHLGEVARYAADPLARARALAALMNVGVPDPGRWRALAPMLDTALGDLASTERELTLTLETGRLLISMMLHDPRNPRAASIAEEFARLAGDTPAECAALAQLAEHRRHCGADAAELGELAERATRTIDTLVVAGVDTPAPYYTLETLRFTDRLDPAERLAEHGVAVARRLGAARSFAAACSHRSLIARARGQLRDAEAEARTATATVTPASEPVWRAMPHIALALCLLDRGDLAGAQEACVATGLDEDVPDYFIFADFLFMRMRLRAAQGRHAAALKDFANGRRLTGSADATGPLVGEYLVAVESHRALGDTDAADGLQVRTVEIARHWGTNRAIGQALRAHGRAAGGTQAIDALHEAIDVLERSPARLEYARALIDLGAALRRAGHRREAREPLRGGHLLARECGADALAETARLELAASGIRLRRPALSGADSLTPSERRIADMAASDTTNAEIAQALFITVKTVEMHLTHAYRKLDITKRTQLPGALGSQATSR
jgi:DNA-binding CsgD family transcriptional regulator